VYIQREKAVGNDEKTCPYWEQQPPYAPAASQVAPPKSLPQRPSVRGVVEEVVGAADEAVVVEEHPFWHPFETKQCVGVVPQYLDIQ
jgi:hypothetical protein